MRTYASLGAEFIVTEIKRETGVVRSVHSVEHYASRNGISLVKYQTCPRCGARRRKLNRNTGLCDICNVYESRDRARRKNAELKALRRELETDDEQSAEFQRVWREYRAISRSNERLLKKNEA